jgi:pSer/pThr/pTyr-binding forkhead associated (FHA) protein
VSRSGAELVVLGDDGSQVDRITITDAPVSIGRMSTNDVVLSDRNVSRRHAEVRGDGVDLTVVDLG